MQYPLEGESSPFNHSIHVHFPGKTVITSDHALKLEFVPEWIAMVGGGYIGLEFSDVYTALGSEVVSPLTLRLFSAIHFFKTIVSFFICFPSLTSFRF